LYIVVHLESDGDRCSRTSDGNASGYGGCGIVFGIVQQ
jgi:hypothetical protein